MRDTLYIVNLGINHKAQIHAYYVRPRRNITFTELNNAASGPGNLTYANGAATVFNAMRFLAESNGQAGYTANPSSGRSMQKWGWDTLGEIPFNNKWFCSNFKILKTKKFQLGPGARCMFSITNRRTVVNGFKLGFYNDSDALTGSMRQEICMTPKLTRFWMIAHHGVLELWGTGGSPPTLAALEAIAAPTCAMGTYHTRQFCIRIDSSQPQPLAGRLSADQTLGTAIPIHIGGRMYPGEPIPVFHAGGESQPVYTAAAPTPANSLHAAEPPQIRMIPSNPGSGYTNLPWNG